jgi:hypothetical protein
MKAPDLCQEKIANWKSRLEKLEESPSTSEILQLSDDRKVLAAQIFAFRVPGPLIQPKYAKFDQFSSYLRNHLKGYPQKELASILAQTEKQIGYLLSEIVWGDLVEKISKHPSDGNSVKNWEQYLEAGLDPTAIKQDYKLAIQSANPLLLKAIKQVMDPSDMQLFCQVLQGPEESACQILPLLKPVDRTVRIGKLNPANLRYLPTPLPEGCLRSLFTACTDYFLQCSNPEQHLEEVEKYLGFSRTQIIAQTLERIYNLQPNDQHLQILADQLRGQHSKLNYIIANSIDSDQPLSKAWQRFLVSEATSHTLLPLLALQAPTSWNVILEAMSPDDLSSNLQNTLIPSLQYPVQVKDWTIMEQILTRAGKLTCFEESSQNPSHPAERFPTSTSYEGIAPLLRQKPPEKCLLKLAALRTSPARFLRDQLLTQGLLNQDAQLIKLSKKTAKAEQKFIQTQIDAETTPDSLTFFAHHLPQQKKLLLETFLSRLSSKQMVGTLRRPCPWYHNQDQVQNLAQLANNVIDSFPESRKTILTYLVRCDLIQHMPSLNHLLAEQSELLAHATGNNLQHLLEQGVYKGNKPDLSQLLNYQNPLHVVPILHRFGIELDDSEFWRLVGKANLENISLLPLIRSILQRKPPKRVDSDILSELTESPLIAMLLEYGVLQPSDTLDNRTLLDWLDREDLLNVLCRINIPVNHPLLMHFASREPESAWQLVQKTTEINQAKANLAPAQDLALELF